VKKKKPQWVLEPAELLTIYMMLSIAATFCSHDMIQILAALEFSILSFSSFLNALISSASLSIARALANDPAIILADEPTGNLDLKTGREIIDLLNELKQERGVTIITATHDMKMLAASDRVLWLEDGLIQRIQSRSQLKIQIGSIDGKEE
jgi:ABC-type phosphate/phosphonate transport system ATPase subunit